MTLVSIGVISLFVSCLGMTVFGHIINIDKCYTQTKVEYYSFTALCVVSFLAFVVGHSTTELLWTSLILVSPNVYYLIRVVMIRWRHARLYFRHIPHGIPLSGICKVLLSFTRILIVTRFPRIGPFWKEGKVKVPHPHNYSDDWGVGKRAIWDVFIVIYSMVILVFVSSSIGASLAILFT